MIENPPEQTPQTAVEALGFTATVPVEIVLAAGLRPLDLNNALIGGPDPAGAVRAAEEAGFPRNSCAWIKGIYSTIKRMGTRRVVGVTQGDCSNTEALLEILADDGVTAVPFAYPADRDPAKLRDALAAFAVELGTDLGAAEVRRRVLLDLRRDLALLDELVVAGKRRGADYFDLALAASDFGGDPTAYRRRLAEALDHGAQPQDGALRLAYLGVPPAFTDLLDRLADFGAEIVFAEIPRQFAMPGEPADLIEQYLAYTYPYGMAFRLCDIRPELRRRRIDGVIHYVQSFCFRHIEDILVRRQMPDLPLLTLEGDRPGPLSPRDLLRLESFCESLSLEL